LAFSFLNQGESLDRDPVKALSSKAWRRKKKTMDMLHNYRDLVAKVDELCRRTKEAFGQHLACRPGCAGCCRHLTLSRVEGVALAEAVQALPAAAADNIRSRARSASASSPCPLLADNRCLLYASRPIICRTHGLPLLATDTEGTRRVDFCPENFRGLDTLPGSAVIDLDRLNTALAAVNALFARECFGDTEQATERIFMAEALLLEP
jgi:Fe-S-cluster containining protein